MGLPPSDPAQPLPDSRPPGEPAEWPLHERLLGAAARAAGLGGLPALFLFGLWLTAPGGQLATATGAALSLLVVLLCPLLLERPDVGWRSACARWALGCALGAVTAPLVGWWVANVLGAGTEQAYRALGGLELSSLADLTLVPWCGAAGGLILAPWTAARLAGRTFGVQGRGFLLSLLGAALGVTVVGLVTRGWVGLVVPVVVVLGGALVAAVLAFTSVHAERLAARLDRHAPLVGTSQRKAEPGREVGPVLLSALGALLIGHTAVRELTSVRRITNDSAARGALRVLETAQTLYREGDKDQNGVIDYAGTLATLGQAGVIDEVLASGVKQGYLFRLVRSAEQPEFVWAVAADPILPGVTGRTHYALDWRGRRWTSDEPIPLDPLTCQPPPGTTEVKR